MSFHLGLLAAAPATAPAPAAKGPPPAAEADHLVGPPAAPPPAAVAAPVHRPAPPAGTEGSRALPTSANPEFMEAISAALASGRDDPEVKAAEKAMRAVHDTNKHRSAEDRKALMEEAQLKVELALLKKAEKLRPGVRETIEARNREIQTRLTELKDPQKKPIELPKITVPGAPTTPAEAKK